MDEKITYTAAYKELQEIVKEIEHAEIDIDTLDVKIKRASDLLKICREKLYETEKNVQEILDKM